MKILQIITKSELGGAQNVLINIVNELCCHHDITVVAGEGDRQMFDMIDSRVTKVYYSHLRRAISLYHDIRTLFFLWKFYRAFRPDVIHLHSSKVGFLGRMILPKDKIIYTVHGFDSIRVAHRKLLPLERIMQNRCSHIVTVSRYDIDNLKKEGIHNNVSLIYNGIKNTENRRELPIDIPHKYSKIVMCIARISEQKRHDIFIECAKLLPNYAFVWIGNLHPVEDLPHNTFFAGNLPNAGEYCWKADVFMLPSNYEGLPIVLLEAISNAKPVVASQVGGVSEIIYNDKNGYTVTNDVNAFAQKIDYILSNDYITKKFSSYSKQLFEKHFTASKMVSEYYNIYKNICKQ